MFLRTIRYEVGVCVCVCCVKTKTEIQIVIIGKMFTKNITDVEEKAAEPIQWSTT